SVIFQGGGIRFLAVILYWSLFGVPSWARMDMLISRENPTASLILTHGAPHVVSRFYTLKARNVNGIRLTGLAAGLGSQPGKRARIFPLTLRSAFAKLNRTREYPFSWPSGNEPPFTTGQIQKIEQLSETAEHHYGCK